MANRTVQLLGYGFGADPAEITVTLNGNTVFSGPVPTLDIPVPSFPNLDLVNDAVVLCTFDIELDSVGPIPMTYSVNNNVVVFAEINANYVGVLNPVYTPEQLAVLDNPDTPLADLVAIFTQVANPPLSQTDIDTLLDPTVSLEEKEAILIAHNCQTTVSSGPDVYGNISDDGDARLNATINGVAKPKISEYDYLIGTVWYTITDGSIMTYDLEVSPAVV